MVHPKHDSIVLSIPYDAHTSAAELYITCHAKHKYHSNAQKQTDKYEYASIIMCAAWISSWSTKFPGVQFKNWVIRTARALNTLTRCREHMRTYANASIHNKVLGSTRTIAQPRRITYSLLLGRIGCDARSHAALHNSNVGYWWSLRVAFVFDASARALSCINLSANARRKPRGSRHSNVDARFRVRCITLYILSALGQSVGDISSGTLNTCMSYKRPLKDQ